jgi:hypothetical protein
MNYSEVYDGKRIKDYDSGVERPIETQGFQPLVFDSNYTPEKEVPVYYQDTETMSFGQCFAMLLSQFIPVVGIVLLFYWGFSQGDVTPKKILARAMLACYAVAAVVFGFFSLFR